MVRFALIPLLLLLLLLPATGRADDGRWSSHSPAPLPRQEAALAELDGKLYFAGGFEHGGAESARHEAYDIVTDTWTALPALPEPSHHLVGVGLQDHVYYLGGLQTLAFAPTGRMWAYHPPSRTWSPKAGLPPGRQRGAGAVTVHDGRIYYVGGQRIVFEGPRLRRIPVAEVDVYDPRTDSWSPLPDMPTARDHFGVGVVNGVLYAVGGRRLAPTPPVPPTEALDLATGLWRQDLAQIPTPRGGFATAVLDGLIVTAGGESFPEGSPPLVVHAHDEVEAYDPAADLWRPLARMPSGRYGIQGATRRGRLWVAGGGAGLSVDATAILESFRR